jgi:hypothetical protein
MVRGLVVGGVSGSASRYFTEPCVPILMVTYRSEPCIPLKAHMSALIIHDGLSHASGLRDVRMVSESGYESNPLGQPAIRRDVPCVDGSGRRRVTREDEVAIFGSLVAGEAGFVQRLVARFAVLEVGESPAASRGVLF